MGESVRAHKELTGGWAKAAQLPRPDLSGLAIKDEHLKRALLGQDFLVVDGAMGTQLQERGLADAGQIPSCSTSRIPMISRPSIRLMSMRVPRSSPRTRSVPTD